MLNAPAAVEWFTEASPNEHTTIASSGKPADGQARQGSGPWAAGRRCPRSAAKARPTARGRCEAIVEVCGMIASSARPNTLCRPPAIGSAAAATSPSSTSRSPPRRASGDGPAWQALVR